VPYQAIKTRDRTVYCSPVEFKSHAEEKAWVTRCLANFNIPVTDVKSVYEVHEPPSGAIIWPDPDAATLTATPAPSEEEVTIESGDGTSAPPTVGVPLGGDNRQAVRDALASPARYVGRIVSTWPNKSKSWGTGVLLYDRYVLTCGHNFYDVENRFSAVRATFQLGLTRDNAGKGIAASEEIDLTKSLVQPEYVQRGGKIPPTTGIERLEVTDYLYDLAVARMGAASPVGDSMFGVALANDDTPFNAPGLACGINGYPSDLDGTGVTQYTRNGNAQLLDDDFVAYRMSTSGGDSGAPVYYQPPGKPFWYVVAVHVTGVSDDPGQNNGFNFGPRLYGRNYDFIQGALDSL
jgi:V8-like Glu-specific endopeptidase